MVDIDTLVDAYLTMKEYVPSKDRQAAADQLIGLLSDSGIADTDLESFGAVDSYLKRAMAEIVGEPDDDELDFEDE